MAINYDFTSTFDGLYEQLDGMVDIAKDMFVNIDDREEIEFGRFCLNRIDELNKLKELAGKLHERMEGIRENLSLSGGSAQSTMVKGGLRIINVEVTKGMLGQSLLSLTSAKKANRVKMGEQFTIKLPGGEQFTTELIDPGNKLRERGRIRAFYESQNVRPGDQIVMKETEKGIWGISVERHEEVLSKLLESLDEPKSKEGSHQ